MLVFHNYFILSCYNASSCIHEESYSTVNTDAIMYSLHNNTYGISTTKENKAFSRLSNAYVSTIS
jgi:hypothetical protein